MHSTALLLDAEPAKVGHEYRCDQHAPTCIVIDPSGKLIYSGAIDSKPTHTTAADDSGARPISVKAALDEAMAGKPVSTPTSRAYGLLDQIRIDKGHRSRRD